MRRATLQCCLRCLLLTMHAPAMILFPFCTCRRYADVVVHRQLLAAVAAGGHELPAAAAHPAAAGPVVPPPLPSAELSVRAAVMNERHRTAKRAQVPLAPPMEQGRAHFYRCLHRILGVCSTALHAPVVEGHLPPAAVSAAERLQRPLPAPPPALPAACGSSHHLWLQRHRFVAKGAVFLELREMVSARFCAGG